MKRPLLPVALLLALATPLVLASCKDPLVLVIDAPLHGSFTTATQIAVSGSVSGVGPEAAQLTINGSAVTVQPDRTWSTTVAVDTSRVFQPVLAELVHTGDGRSKRQRVVVHYGESRADGAFSEESVAMRLNDTGLDQVEPVVTGLVDLDLAELVPPGTLIIDNYCYSDTIFGCLGRVDVTISGSPPPEIGSFAIDVDSQTDFAEGDITVTDLYVRADVDDATGVPLSCTIDITAATTDVEGDYALDPLASDPTQLDVTQLGSVALTLGGFSDSTDCGGLLGGLVEVLIDLFIGDIQDLVEPALVDFLNAVDPQGNTPVAGALEGALAGIQIAGPIGEALAVQFDAPLFQVVEDPEGITLGSDGAFVADVGTGPGQCPPTPGAPDLAASYHVDEPFPTFSPLTPGGLPYGLGLSVSTSAFNQLLKAQVECGLLVVSLTELEIPPIFPEPTPITSDLLSIFVPQFGDLAPGTPLRIDIAPTLAPVITGQTGPAGELADLRLAGLDVAVRVNGGENKLALSGRVDALMGLDLAFDEATSSLLFQLGQPEPADVQVAILRNPIGANPTSLEQYVLPGVIAQLLPDLASELQAFPLPQFLGLSLQGVEVSRQGAFLSLFADLGASP